MKELSIAECAAVNGGIFEYILAAVIGAELGSALYPILEVPGDESLSYKDKSVRGGGLGAIGATLLVMLFVNL